MFFFFHFFLGSKYHYKYHYKRAIISSSQQNAIQMAFRWCADDGPTLKVSLAGQLCGFQGIQTSIAKKPYIFVIFQGVGGGGVRTPVPPLDLNMFTQIERLFSTVTVISVDSSSIRAKEDELFISSTKVLVMTLQIDSCILPIVVQLRFWYSVVSLFFFCSAKNLLT